MAERVKRFNRIQVVLTICILLIAILAMSNIWLYITIDGQQKQINSLETDKKSLEYQVRDLQETNTNLESYGNDLLNMVNSLRAPQLHEVNVAWSDNRTSPDSPHISLNGTIFNSGEESAPNVKITVEIYDNVGNSLKKEEVLLGEIAGKSYKNFDTDIAYSGDADYITKELTFGPP